MPQAEVMKWVSVEGILLGTFTMPDDLAREMLTKIVQHQEWRHFLVDLEESHAFSAIDEIPRLLNDKVHQIVIGRAWRHRPWNDDDMAFDIYGITPDALERLPGWSFSPSLAYIRHLTNLPPAVPG